MADEDAGNGFFGIDRGVDENRFADWIPGEPTSEGITIEEAFRRARPFPGPPSNRRACADYWEDIRLTGEHVHVTREVMDAALRALYPRDMVASVVFGARAAVTS